MARKPLSKKGSVDDIRTLPDDLAHLQKTLDELTGLILNSINLELDRLYGRDRTPILKRRLYE